MIKACHWNRVIRRLERKLAVRQPDGSLTVTRVDMVSDPRARQLPALAWWRSGWRRSMWMDAIVKGGRCPTEATLFCQYPQYQGKIVTGEAGGGLTT